LKSWNKIYKTDNLKARTEVNQKESLPKPTLKKWPTPKNEFAFPNLTIKQNLRIKDDFAFALGCLTVCVTRAGAGGGTPSNWENAKA
jgi:hypothetical protein